ncbi:type II toxin-antitoxin system HicB family antitoxin [Glutamicibacter sp. NPDC087344]|uniref:type II toxin-antitoxin system HicB family antitoxin n=1 Tax=Glutamicibacter sp. NPDC087344 TaxID=3363994 RepID=UPI00382DBE1E
MSSVVAHYVYSVVWSPEDEEYVASVAEFPSLSWMDEDQVEALLGLRSLLREVIEDMEANGEDVPSPITERKYSGNIKLRVSPEKHRELTIAAATQGVSLNRYLSERLASV